MKKIEMMTLDQANNKKLIYTGIACIGDKRYRRTISKKARELQEELAREGFNIKCYPVMRDDYNYYVYADRAYKTYTEYKQAKAWINKINRSIDDVNTKLNELLGEKSNWTIKLLEAEEKLKNNHENFSD